MTRKIDHTFVIPAYKDSPFIGECIESLLRQTVKSEILISTSTPSIYFENVAKKYKLNLYVGNGSGIASDWSFAYGLAKTKYVTLAHQDDIYNENYTEECLKMDSNSLIVFTDYCEITNTGEIRPTNINLLVKRILLIPFLFKNNFANKFIKKTLLAFGNPYCCPSGFFNKKLIGKFVFDGNLGFTVDWDAWVRISELDGKVSFNWKKLLKHRIYSGSETSRQIRINNRVIEEYNMFRRMWPNPVAKLLSKFYANGQLSNRIK